MPKVQRRGSVHGMGDGYVRNGRRRYRRHHRLQRDRRAVVSVVGTLLALLVFFALFGIFLTQYVPLWMIDNESQFTGQAQASLADLKSNMDLQAALDGPAVYATPIVMSSQGVPLIAQPTAGILNFVPSVPGVFANVSMNVGPGGGQLFFQNFSLGTVQMTLPNRYYNPQQFELEDDAVVQSQGDTQQLVTFPPSISVNQTGTQIGVALSLMQMYGNATQTVSSGTQEVYSHFVNVQQFTSNGKAGAAFGARFQLGTHFPCAWANYLNETMTKSGIGYAHWHLTPGGCVASKGKAVLVTLQFTNINSITLVLGQFDIVVGVGLG